MIRLTRLNGKQFVLNCELIRSIEATPDTVITLTLGDKLMVLEDVDAVIEATLLFKQRINQKVINPETSCLEQQG